MTHPPAEPRDPTRRLWSISAGLSVVGAAAAGAALTIDDGGFGSVALIVVFAALLTLTRVLPFLLVRRGEGEEISADEAVLVAMLVLLPAAGVLSAALAGTALAHVVRRRSAMKSVFNHAAQALGVSAALLVEHLLGDPDVGSTSLAALAAASVGVLSYSLLNSAAIWLALGTATGMPVRQLASDGVVIDVLAAVAAAGWGVLAVAATANELAAVAVLAVPIAGSWLVRHNEQQHRSMRALLSAAVATGQAVRSGSAAQELTTAADEILRTRGSRLVSGEPDAAELAAPLRSRGIQRWLVAGGRHRWDRRRRADQTLLDALAAIGNIALDNEALLESVGRDPETGLITGALLHERMDVLIEQHHADGLTLVVVRVPRLDIVKQALGPDAARRERAEIGRRLRLFAEEPVSEHSSPKLVGFLGDGDFAVVLPGVASRSLALGLARGMQRALQDPVDVDGVALSTEVTMAVRVCAPDETDAVTAGDLLRDAVATAARIARVGGERIQFAQPHHLHASAPSFALEAELRRALHAGDLLVAYQPVIAADAGHVVGAEALVRWKHADRGWLPPGEFIPVAEQSRLIVDVDRYVLREVVDQLGRWHEHGLPPSFAVSVNVSARHLAEPDTARFLRTLVQGTTVEPHRLRLEVTESSVTLDAGAAASTLDELHRLGFGIAIDDFGTGYSSLLYLRDFPADTLKIDRSFIDRMASSPGDAAIVAAIIRLGHTLGLSTVAEGVETDEQLAALRSLGCDAAQGFLWSDAVRPERFREQWWPDGDVTASADRSRAAESPDDAVRDDVLPYLIHELRSPLISVDAYAGLAAHGLDDGGDAEVRLYVDRIRHAAAAMQAVLDDLGAVSTLDLAGMALDVRTVELNALVRAALDTIRPTVDGQRIELVAGPPVDVDVDAHRIGQVLRNLISNAAKFSPVDRPIEVQVRHDGGGCRVDVRDHGCGVPPERVGQLFRRFSRLGSTTKGMGIGLHLARKVARAHGGDVTYAAPPEGDGSIFSIHLPASSRSPAAAAAAPPLETGGPTTTT